MKSIVRLTILAVFATVGCTAMAQQPWSQANACPGWSNPTNFSAMVPNTTKSAYGGAIGSKGCQSGVAGMNFTQTITASNMATASNGGSSSGPTVPSGTEDYAFTIMNPNMTAGGGQANRDPMTGNGLRFVPDQFNTHDTSGLVVNTNITRSIRIGDAKCGGKAAALYYTVVPKPNNAFMFIYYACVVQIPYSTSCHGIQCDPNFIIRVTKKNSSGQWVEFNDSLTYTVPSTPAQNQGITTESGCGGYGQVVFGQNGWTRITSPQHVAWKDWEKVAINLSGFLYDTLRIEVMTGDCCYSAHWAYGYITGECRPMTINTAGCPPGMSTDVATLAAPRGMRTYQWAASNMGVAEPVTSVNPGASNSWFTFRDLTTPLSEAGGANYEAQASDFAVRYRPNAAHQMIAVSDSMGQDQTFRCRMTSALDPAKPFTSDLFVNVRNTKPTMKIDSLSFCDGNVRLWNRSYVPGATGLVVDSVTRWSFYSNVNCNPNSLIDSAIGDSCTILFPDTNYYGVIARTFTIDSSCYSEGMYVVKPMVNPTPKIKISKKVLCDADETTITDSTVNVRYREWRFKSETVDGAYDTIANEQSITRPFTHSVEPIELYVRNGLYYVNPYNTADTIWCSALGKDTVGVFTHPELEVTGDTIVCQGSKTNATVRALGADSCTYEWSLTYGAITGNIGSGNRLQVAPYADTSVYFVRVISHPEGCVAWDSIHAYLVRPQLSMVPDAGAICPGDTVVLTGSAADHYSWTASPADPSLEGQQNADEIVVTPRRTTVYTMVGHGTNDCNASPLQKTVTVQPLPTPKIQTNPSFVDPDDPTLVLRDVSPNGITTQWLFSNGEQSTSREVSHTFNEAIDATAGSDSVYVQLTTGNILNCETTKTFGIPVILYTAWLPNIFTPGSEDDNARFRLFSVNHYENFHIYIYNRQGTLVFESDDPDFEWDGTYNGQPCPQGVYAYVCNYRKPKANTLSSRSGTVTLIR